MKVLEMEGRIFRPQQYKNEAELQRYVEQNIRSIFGEDSVWFSGARIGAGRGKKGAKGIPDGFVFNLKHRSWTIVEVELARHSLHDHINPQVTRFAVARKKNRNKRKNEAFRRQGEWFFIPLPNFEPPRGAHVGRNEPLQRDGNSKPHICEELYQSRGKTIMTHREHAPKGISIDQYNSLERKVRQAGGWRRQSRVSRAYVRGKVRHPDHHTITLPGWHEVMLNREGAVRNSVVTFID